MAVADPTDKERDQLSEQVIGTAIRIHRHLGPALLEHVYQLCLMIDLRKQGLEVEREVSLPVTWEGVRIDGAYRIDLLVNNELIIEVKAVEKILPVHKAQIISYLRLANKSRGLLINFHAETIKAGLSRAVNSKAISV